MQQAVRKQIENHVSIMLVYQEAKKTYPDKAAEAFDKEVEKELQKVVQERYDGVYAKYEARIKSMEMTMADIRARLKRQIMVMQYVHDRFKPMIQDPSRRQLYSYYQEHQNNYFTPERAELFLIEIPIDAMLGKPRKAATNEEVSAATREAMKQMKRAREELDRGVDFATVAKAYSKGPKAMQGGNWGEIGRNSLQGRWAKAAEVLFTLDENQTSDIIETPEAWFIVHCGKRTPAVQLSFEDVQSKIVESIRNEQFERLSRQHVSELLSKASIRPVDAFTLAVMAAAPRPSNSNLSGKSAGDKK